MTDTGEGFAVGGEIAENNEHIFRCTTSDFKFRTAKLAVCTACCLQKVIMYRFHTLNINLGLEVAGARR